MEQLAQKSTSMSNWEQRGDLSKAAQRGDKQTRRRSHRPRGCRGGSNRRKNKWGENINAFNKPKRGLTKKQGSFKNQRSSFDKGSKASTYLNGRSVMKNHAPTNMGHQMGECECDPTLSLQEHGAPLAEMYYSSNSSSSSDLYQSETDLQESLSESSEEGIPNPNDGGLILPPLVTTNVHEREAVTFRGPNPYALHQSRNHTNIAGPRLPGYGMYNINNVQVPEAGDMKEFYNNGNGYSENPAHADLLAFHLSGLESEAVRQLSEQLPLRQVRGGGSLFCTSPRSFLMGTKKNNTSTRSE